MFRCCLIKADGEVTELSFSHAGGLEADELQRHCKSYFTPVDEAASRAVLEEALLAQGTDPAQINAALMKGCGDMRVEIKTLSPPSVANDYIGVSMYCDANAAVKNASYNSKATDIIRRCGYGIPVQGDVFVSRVYDNEEFPWERQDFTIDDLADNAAWLLRAEIANAGKSMDKFSSSGALSNLSKTNIADEAGPNDGTLTWTQTREEVEVRIRVPPEYKAKDMTVVIKPSHVLITFPTPVGVESSGRDLARIQEAPKGIEMFGKISVDDSSWSLDGVGDRRCLTLSLAKSTEGLQWLTLSR
jgi:hypothetical protein